MSGSPPASEQPDARSQWGGPEARIAPRTSVEKTVEMRPPDGSDEPIVNARLVDISASGVGLRVAMPISAGTLFRLASLAGKGLLYRVVRCRRLGATQFDVGAVFVRTLNTNQPPTEEDFAATVRWIHETSSD